MNMVVLIGRLVRDPSYSEVETRKKESIRICIILSGGAEKF